MEPSEMDQIIKSKLSASSDLYRHEIDSSKPLVWSAVQNQIGPKVPLAWYHLAAAVLLLTLCFSFILYYVQEAHNKELYLLSVEIDQLKGNYLSQVQQLNAKDNQVKSLGSELKKVEQQLSYLQQQKPKTVVIQSDTVLIKQVEYITTVSTPSNPEEQAISTTESQPEQIETNSRKEREVDEVIFPSYSTQGHLEPETLKFKFGPLQVRNN